MGSDSVTFQEAAKLVRQGVNPEDVGDMPYVGLEHIEEGTLRLIGIGNAQSVSQQANAVGIACRQASLPHACD